MNGLTKDDLISRVDELRRFAADLYCDLFALRVIGQDELLRDIDALGLDLRTLKVVDD